MYIEFVVSFDIHYVLDCHCVDSVFVFFLVFYFVIDEMKTVASGLRKYIHMIIENHLP